MLKHLATKFGESPTAIGLAKATATGVTQRIICQSETGTSQPQFSARFDTGNKLEATVRGNAGYGTFPDSVAVAADSEWHTFCLRINAVAGRSEIALDNEAFAIADKGSAFATGTMNNCTMGGQRADGSPWAYYETLGGGMGAHPAGDGLSGAHVHMSNTLNTPVEALEMAYPLRLVRYQLRRGSGGAGKHRGGDGLIREYELLGETTVTVLSERRVVAPWGLAGGGAGAGAERA